MTIKKYDSVGGEIVWKSQIKFCIYYNIELEEIESA